MGNGEAKGFAADMHAWARQINRVNRQTTIEMWIIVGVVCVGLTGLLVRSLFQHDGVQIFSTSFLLGYVVVLEARVAHADRTAYDRGVTEALMALVRRGDVDSVRAAECAGRLRAGRQSYFKRIWKIPPKLPSV